jgi:arsenite methyltransferase
MASKDTKTKKSVGAKSGSASSKKPTAEEIRKAVRDNYTKLAMTESSCCSTTESASCGCGGLYPQAEIVSLPSEAVAVSAGCGNPTAIANLKSGMTVVDLGSGGGIDCFLSAKKVGEKGKVIGIDATPEMIWRARKTADENGFKNVEFRLGEIEHMPLERDTADVIISNCVINLSPDKEQVFRDAFRVLKPGGKLAVSDIVLLKDLPDFVRHDLGTWSKCVSGAIREDEYMGAMKRAGFEKIKVEDRVVYTHDQLLGYAEGTVSFDDAKLKGVNLADLVASYKISAVKPKK